MSSLWGFGMGGLDIKVLKHAESAASPRVVNVSNVKAFLVTRRNSRKFGSKGRLSKFTEARQRRSEHGEKEVHFCVDFTIYIAIYISTYPSYVKLSQAKPSQLIIQHISFSVYKNNETRISIKEPPIEGAYRS
jgi:hypothetical protein